MVDGTVDADRLLPTLCVQWLLPYFLKLQTTNDVATCNQPVKKHVSDNIEQVSYNFFLLLSFHYTSKKEAS